MIESERADLVGAYTEAFGAYLAEPSESGLLRAYELGRSALAGNLGILEIAAVHAQVLAGAVRQPRGHDLDGLLDASERFCAELLAPFEMAHRGFREANTVLRRLNDVLEVQARRIASSLHDEAAQLLIPVHLGLVDLGRKISPTLAPDVQKLRSLLEEVEGRLRQISHELRPPILEHLGLLPALEFLADSTSKRWGFPVHLELAVGDGLPSSVETTLYRVIQEALTNVAKHAEAQHADVSISRTSRAVVCSVRDDGVGLDAARVGAGMSRGMGLLEITERVNALGGTLRLRPNVDRGTDLTVEIPLEF